MDGTLIETDDQAVVALSERLKRVRIFLPQGDTQRAARRLVMWSHDGLNNWLVLLDRIGLDRPAQRLAQRFGLLNDAADDKVLIPVAGTTELLRQLSGRYKLGHRQHTTHRRGARLPQPTGTQRRDPGSGWI